MTEWFKPIIVTGSLLLMAVEAFSQSDTTELRLRYEKDRRDVTALTAYTEALEQAGETKKSESLIRDFMSRCPVTQIEDRDTYMLISRYVFEDVYSNAFEYALFLMPRMKWDMPGLTPKQKALQSKRKLADLRWGVSHGDEVDKRFEVLSLLSRKLNKAVSEQCDPVWQKDSGYTMPDYSEAKIKHLGRLLDKGNVIDRDAMRTKLRIAEAVNTGRHSKALQYLCMASALDIQGINGTYIIGMMNILADLGPDAADRSYAIDTLNRLCRLSESAGGGQNYYTVLGKLYRQAGENVIAEECLEKGEAIESERQALYQQMMNPTP